MDTIHDWIPDKELSEYDKLHQTVLANIEEIERMLSGTVPGIMLGMLKLQVEELKKIK